MGDRRDAPTVAPTTPPSAEPSDLQLEQDLNAINDPAAEERAKSPQEQTIDGFLRSLGTAPSRSASVRRSRALNSPEEDFLEDLQSGTQKAQEYVEYVNQALQYAQEWGVLPEEVRRAATNMRKIANGINEGLEVFGRIVGVAQDVLQLRDWLVSLNNLAEKTAALDMRDRASVQAWVNAAQDHFDRTRPYIQSLQRWLLKAAQRGSAAAARASLVLSIFTAYAEVGLAALEAGINNVNAYLNRMEAAIREAEGRTPQRPPPPAYPGDWLTVAERRARADFLRELDARLAAQRQREERRRTLIEQFNTRHFPAIFLRERRRMMDQILRDFQAGRPVTRLTTPEGHAELPGLAPGRWWDCFTSTGGDTFFDERAGAHRVPKKEQVNAEEARTEMDNFGSVQPPCPYYDEIYQRELNRFLAANLASERGPPSRGQTGLEIAALGLAVFETGRSVATGGDLAFEAAPASYRHDHTPPEIAFTRYSENLMIKANHPRAGFGWQHFWFSLRFDYNGYDIRDCTLNVLIDRSSAMHASTFAIKFDPQAHSARNEPVAEIVYKISGRWNPVGRGDVSFSGDLHIKANGEVWSDQIQSEQNWVLWGGRDSLQRNPLPAPIVVTEFHDVFFSPPGAHRLDDASIRAIHEWHNRADADRRRQLEMGTKPFILHGYASTTDSVARNQELARKRIEAVQQVLRDLVGSQAQFQTFAHGELRAQTGDNVEAQEERRVRIEVRTVSQP
jgi:outer membrane protein OmpA-like peptidoglycan-associated protein